MDLIADGLLITTALTAALYCHVLSRRLRKLGELDRGIGAQIGNLDSTLEETRNALADTQAKLDHARAGSQSASERLKRDIAAAKRLSEELEDATRMLDARLRKLFEAESAPPEPAARLDGGIEIVASDHLDAARNSDAGPDDPAGIDGSEGDEQSHIVATGPPVELNGAASLAERPAETAARLPKVRRMGL